ncbi:MAG: multi-sensor signal transduction multi-kinase [Firmicutes bacterium]|nr:multi-sensor signal transduction multi-kinase [Bacillota bacterium]
MINLDSYMASALVCEEESWKMHRVYIGNNNQPMLLKIMIENATGKRDWMACQKEFKFIRELNKSGCRHIIGAVSAHNDADGSYMLLENFSGLSLQNIHHHKQATDQNFLLTVAIDLVEAVEHLHFHGILHNNLRPGVIIVEENSGQVVIVDYMYACKISDTKEIHPRKISILKKMFNYMAPERTGRTKHNVDFRSDLYSLGIILYELFGGLHPFQAEDLSELVHCQLAIQPKPLYEVDSSIPRVLSEIISKLLAKDPDDRYLSAYGLKRDLEYCQKQWKNKNNIPDIYLGQYDWSGIIEIPNSLYGRTQELITIDSVFQRARMGDGELLLIAGYSGIGKTTLIEKAGQSFEAKGACFVKGKFDQAKHNAPYSAWTQIFTGLVTKILQEDESVQNALQKYCIAALKDQGNALIPLITNLEQFLGQQPAITKLDPKQAELRMFYALENFIRALAGKERPLILFVDDLQWADPASLNLLTRMLNMGLKSVFIIGSYRENEIDSNHPLQLEAEVWQAQNRKVTMLSLMGLSVDVVNQYVADALKLECPECRDLSKVVYEKTEGNIFFVIQFINLLKSNEMLIFRRGDCVQGKTGRWEWNAGLIQEQCVAENVVDLIIHRIFQLPLESREVIQVAACIGHSFSIDALQLALNVKKNALYRILFNLSMIGIVIIENNVARFAHDRFQQACYSLIDKEDRPALHLLIGRTLLDMVPLEYRQEKIFDIVAQWNKGISELKQSQDCMLLAQLNLEAGQTAKEHSAFDAAMDYFEKGLLLLSVDCWQCQYELALAVYTELAETAFLTGDHASAQKWTEELLQHAKIGLDQFTAYQVQVYILMAQNRLHDAVNTGLQYLSLIGETIPELESTDKLAARVMGIKKEFGDNPAENWSVMPAMTDLRCQSAMQMMALLITPVYMASLPILPQIVLNMLGLSIKHGNTQQTAYAWCFYGLILASIYGDVEDGYGIGRGALKMCKQFGNREIRTTATFYMLLSHRKQPIRDMIKPLQELYTAGLQIGDLDYACQGVTQYGVGMFHSGVNLDSIEGEIASLLATIQGHYQQTTYNRLAITLQTIINLRESSAPHCLTGPVFDERLMVDFFRQRQDAAAIFIWATRKIMLCYLFDHDAEAQQAVNLVTEYHANTLGQVYECNYHFYLALWQIKKLNMVEEKAVAGAVEHINMHRKILREWARHAPMNYLHKYQLVEAEYKRVKGQEVEALNLYDQAIQNAGVNGFIQDEALALELAGRLHLATGRSIAGEAYFRKAWKCYIEWGARAKADHLIGVYRKLGGNALRLITATNPKKQDIDLHSIMEAAQTLSEEIELHVLMRKMIQIVMTNAGATRGYFLMLQDGRLVVKTGGLIDPACNMLTPIDMEGDITYDRYNSSILPWSIVDHALQEQKMIIVENALSDPRFWDDSYISTNKPRSILCMPLRSKNELIGVLYLENQVLTGAFTENRAEVLKMLSSQIVISLENAGLYAILEEKVRQRTAELLEANAKLEMEISERKQMKRALSKLDRLNLVGQMAASIGHEIRNPMTTVRGYLQMLNRKQNYKEHHSMFALMIEELDRANSIITEYLSLAGDKYVELTHFNLKYMIETIYPLLQADANERGHTISLELDTVSNLWLDENEIRQLIINLVRNSMEAIERNGNIVISTYEENGDVVLAVQDNGPGMPKHVLDFLGTPFITTKKNGTGLGIPVCFQIAEHHKATLDVTSGSEGTTFFVRFKDNKFR